MFFVIPLEGGNIRVKITIFGGSGFIGSALTEFWLEKECEIIVVSRKKAPEVPVTTTAKSASDISWLTWDELKEDPSPLENADAFVNLAGATLNQRWSGKAKQCILDSRLDSTREVSRLASSVQKRPEVIVQASAVGIYGTSLTDVYTEAALRGRERLNHDFLSEVTKRWEDTADKGFHGCRLVKLRTGLVLGKDGGAFPLMKLPFLLGVGGKIGSGRQWMPWIHLHDLVRLVDYCVRFAGISGPVNAVAPNPVTNEEFSSVLGQVYHRPVWLPLPSPLLKLLLGEMSMLLLEGQKVIPETALREGFHFSFPRLEDALRALKK